MTQNAPTDFIVTNATIVTCNAAHDVITNGAIHIEDGKLAAIGTANDLAPLADAGRPMIDANGKILMPGLINAHCHAGDSLFRGLVEDLPLEDWLQLVWKAEGATLSEKNCLTGAKLGLAELLLSGVTSVVDMFWHPEQTFAAADMLGMRLVSGGIFFGMKGMDGKEPSVRAKDAQRMFKDYGGSDKHILGTYPHGTYTCDPETIREAFAIAREHDGVFSTHAAETRAEQKIVTDRYGLSIIRHLHALEALDPRTLLAHCVHIDDEEIDLLAETGTHVAHNPLSNLKLGSGFAPVPKMLAAGVNIALGTDGAISGNDLDMWLAMRLAATLHKAVHEDATLISTADALHMATLNGAKALRADDRLGSIEVGKQADFILVETNAPHAIPMFSPINHLVFSAGRGDVRDVFVAGRQLVNNRQFTQFDFTALSAEVLALKDDIASSI